MRRAIVAALSSIAVLGSSLAMAPASQAAENPMPPTQFGMHVIEIAQGAVPTVAYGGVRLWDAGVAWGQVEQKKGKYWWNGMDAAIANANSQQKSILYVLGSTPAWAATNKSQGKYPNKGAASNPNMKDWKSWVTAVVKRYGASIDAYQIWNEANLADFYQGTPAQMADLTKAAYQIIRKYDPTAKVVSASSTVRLESAYKRFFPAYMKALKKKGWPIDVVSVHTYPEGLGTPTDRADYLQQVRTDMRKSKVPASKALWDTEINYGIKGPGKIKGRQITGDSAAAWVAQTYLQDLLYGVDRAYWYYWYRADGRLGIVLQPGTPGAAGYNTAYNWIAGSYYTCTPGDVNTCQFGDAVDPEVVVWAQDADAAYTVPANATVMCTALNACTPVAPGTSMTVGSMPLWFGSDARNAANQAQFATQVTP